jgi:Kdo2-lipid IVA lauroyltransferase/acyltransferase
MQSFSRLIHPRYWLTWISLGCLYCINLLPWRLKMAVGRGLGYFAYFSLKRFRTIARINLKLCFPQWSEAQRQQLLKAHFKSLGMGVIETAASIWTPNKRFTQIKVQIEGLEQIQELQSNKQGVLILIAHFTSLSICERLFHQFIPIYGIYRTPSNAVINYLLQKKHQQRNMSLIYHRDLKKIFKTLKQGQVVLWAMDQDYGPKHSEFVPFFNIQTATITAAERYVKNTDAKLMSGFYFRVPEGYRIIFQPIKTAVMQQFNQQLQDAIMLHPEQYLWIHRRFKTRPNQEKDFYCSDEC